MTIRPQYLTFKGNFPIVILLSAFSISFWPQEIEYIKNKVKDPATSTASLTSYDINKLAQNAMPESMEMLFEVADTGHESMQILAFRKILDLYRSKWHFTDKYHEKLTTEKILLKWINSQSPFQRRTACQMIGQGGFVNLKSDIQFLLYDSDYDVKLDCTRAFFEIHCGAKDKSLVIEKYPQILSSGYHEIKNAVLKGLGDLKIKESFPTVVTMLGSDNPTTRSLALIAAATIDPEKAFPYISSSLHDEAFQVRLSAISALGRIRTEQSLKKLKVLTSDASVRATALREISRICLPMSIDILLEFIEDKHLASTAAEGLMNCNKVTPEKIGNLLLKSDNEKTLSYVLQIILAGPSGSYLDFLLQARDKVAGLESMYLRCLVEMEDRKSLIAILSFTESGSEKIRLEALLYADLYFEKWGYDSIAADIIINFIFDESDEIQEQAILMSGKYGMKEAAPFLKSFLASSSETKKIAAAVSLLGIGEHAVDDIVIEGLFSLDSSVRRACAEAIKRSGLTCSGKNLDATVRDPVFYDSSVIGYFERFVATGSILKVCNDSKGSQALKNHLGNSNEEIATLAALAAIESSRDLLLDEVIKQAGAGDGHRLRELSTYLWMADGERGKQLLQLFLGHEDAYVRSGAVLSLLNSSAFNEKEKIKFLMLRLDDDFEGVRVNAMTGLAKYPGEAEKHAAGICKKLDRPLTFTETVAALHLCSTVSAECINAKLERLILSPDGTIKKSAIKAAEKIFLKNEKLILSEKLHYTISKCSLSYPDKKNRAICSSILKTDMPVDAYSSYTFPLTAVSVSMPPLKYAIKLPAGKGNLSAKKEILANEFSIKQLKHYPAYYPFYFLGENMNIYFVFKGSRHFSGLDFEAAEIYFYMDPLKKK